MKNMKRCLVLIFCLLVILPTCVFAAKKNKNLVNVYIFEAGGCGYCAQQIEHLKSLPSYNKKFKIVEKELYESTSTWKQGADYKLGSSVANLFYDQGFTDASITGTPFMVISDLYAATGYYTASKLEEIIDQAYKDGDKDIVSCVEKGKSNCLDKDAKPVVTPQPTTTSSTTTTARTLSDKEKKNNGVILIIVLGIAVVLMFISRKGNVNNLDDEDEDDDYETEDENEDDESEDDIEDEDTLEDDEESEEDDKKNKTEQKKTETKKVTKSTNVNKNKNKSKKK